MKDSFKFSLPKTRYTSSKKNKIIYQKKNTKKYKIEGRLKDYSKVELALYTSISKWNGRLPHHVVQLEEHFCLFNTIIYFLFSKLCSF